ncbi:hypothetical protein JW756_05090 [Candidatus Woesearchaeota archaeon]|nr:hypothetical protein [Candidatus Woesearchaeota archaeon]
MKKETKDNNDEISILKNKISYLEEELVRKDKENEKLKQENLILFKTALKRSEQKVTEKKIDEKKRNE